MRRMVNWIIHILNYPKIHYKTRLFYKQALVGANTTFGTGAYCVNQTGKKENLRIGHHCDIHACIAVQQNGKISIGDYTTLRGGIVGAVEGIKIGSHCIISNHVTIYDNNNHPTAPHIRKKMCESGWYSELWNWKYSAHKPVVIEDNVWIGEYATILKGVTIGEGAVVGCHSVVTHDVAPYTVVAGNPARWIKDLSQTHETNDGLESIKK